MIRSSLEYGFIANPLRSGLHGSQKHVNYLTHNAVLKKSVHNYQSNKNHYNRIRRQLYKILPERAHDVCEEVMSYLYKDEFGPPPQFWKGTKYYRHESRVQWRVMWKTISGRLSYLGYPTYDFGPMLPFDINYYYSLNSVTLTDDFDNWNSDELFDYKVKYYMRDLLVDYEIVWEWYRVMSPSSRSTL